MSDWIETDSLKRWFLEGKRDLPWRLSPTPYAVWISEMMLQQTQVSVVVPYFERWMDRFPTIADLASAPLDEVIKLWEGLGYYSRARYLHAGARTIMDLFNGELPSNREDLKKIKGLGAYTIGAILSFAFHHRTPAVDGNVMRVLSRYFHVEDEIGSPSAQKKIRALAEQILPQDEHWIINEALIELGATVCKRNPNCSLCPLKKSCQAFLKGRTSDLPVKISRAKTEKLYRSVAVVSCGELLLVRKANEGEIMSGLHEFPYFETAIKGISVEALVEKLKDTFGLQVCFKKKFDDVKHSFTRFQVSLRPVLFTVNEPCPIEGFFWVSMDNLKNLAFSSGHRRILQQMNNIKK